LYGYVVGDPVNGIDPEGLDAFLGSRGVVGTGGAGQHLYIAVDASYPGDPKARIISFGPDDNGNLTINTGKINQKDSIDWSKSADDDVSPLGLADDLLSAVAGNMIPDNDYGLLGPNSNSAAAATILYAGGQLPGDLPGHGWHPGLSGKDINSIRFSICVGP